MFFEIKIIDSRSYYIRNVIMILKAEFHLLFHSDVYEREGTEITGNLLPWYVSIIVTDSTVR